MFIDARERSSRGRERTYSRQEDSDAQRERDTARRERSRSERQGNWRPLRAHEEDLRNRLRNQNSLSNLARNPKFPFNKIERQIFVRLSCYLFLLY